MYMDLNVFLPDRVNNIKVIIAKLDAWHTGEIHCVTSASSCYLVSVLSKASLIFFFKN